MAVDKGALFVVVVLVVAIWQIICVDTRWTEEGSIFQIAIDVMHI